MTTTCFFLMIIFVAGNAVQMSVHFDGGLRTGEYCQWQTFEANCSSTEVLLIESATYGRMKIGGCIKNDYNILNCTANVLKVVDWSCSGKQGCSIPVVQFSLLGFHPCTEEMTSYLQVAYRCVQVEQMIHAFGSCKSPSLLFIQSSQSGYLTFQSPPSHYVTYDSDSRRSNFVSDSKPCGWTLTSTKGHRVLISLYRFSDPKLFTNKTNNLMFASKHDILNSESCRHVAIVRDKTSGREIRACSESDQRIENIFLSDGNSVDVSFTSAIFGSHVRHLIKYQVTSCLIPSFAGSHVIVVSLNTVHVMCNATGEKWILTCLDASWTGVVGSCPDGSGNEADDQSTASMWSTITSEWKSPKGLTLVICLGVLLGIAVGMMMLSFAICLIKQKPRCISEGERPVDMELYEEANGPRFCPMRFAPSATPNPQIADNSNTSLHDQTVNYWDHCFNADKCSFGQTAPPKNSFTPTWQHKPDPNHQSYQSGSIMSSGIVKSHKSPLLSTTISEGDCIQKYSDELKLDGVCPDVVRGPSIHPGFQTVIYTDHPAPYWNAKVYDKPQLCLTEEHHHLPIPPQLCSCSN